MLVFRGLGGDHYVESFLGNLPGGLHGAMFVVMAMIFVLGFFLDPFEIIFIMVPLSAPALITLGADPLWLGVLVGLNLQTSFLTPPFGFTLFYLRGVAPPSVRTFDIYAGIIPFVLMQFAIIAAVWVFPEFATALPRWMFGG
jgi:TRAP-type mannitol/chloroaromatic compound transport system permease large subunit